MIGRDHECEIKLKSKLVSRRHARLILDNDGHLIEDLGSGNGTRVNGWPIEESVRLKHGDQIKLGPTLLRYESLSKADASSSKSNATSSVPRPFQLDLTSGEDDTATISGSLESSSLFGMFDVRPEEKLKGVLEISRSLAGSVDLDSMLHKVLDTLFQIFPNTDRGSILLRDEQSGEMMPAVQKHRLSGEDQTVKLSRTILQKVLEEKTSILSADAASDSRFDSSASISNLTIRSMMCVPMLGLNDEPRGIINLNTQTPITRFTKDDLDLLRAVASQAALSLESIRLMASHLEKEKLESEMTIARGVQEALLPKVMPTVPGYEFYASYDSAQAVGGDYYDVFPLRDDKVCVSFGDVAGKGVPAALVMSRIASVVQSTLQHVTDVLQAVSAINNHICYKAVAGRFVTYILIIIDLKTHEMTGVIAGHIAPLVRTTIGEIEEFGTESIGIPIGVVEDYPFEVAVRKIEPGETIVIYTDGVSEAINPDGERYGMETVRRFAAKCQGNAAELGKALLEDVRRHANGHPQNDDITILTFSRNAA